MRFLFFCLMTACLFGRVEDHFRKIRDKSDLHKMRNVDFIYLINLDERPEKYADTLTQLAPYGIYPYRFAAVNGWKLTLEQLTDLGVSFKKGMRSGMIGTYFEEEKGQLKARYEEINKEGRTYFCNRMPLGSIGIVLSHLSILQDAYDSGYETIWVMEDDIEVLQNPHIISDLVKELDHTVGKNNWDILFTDQDSRDRNGNYIPSCGFAPRPNYEPKKPSKHYKKQNISERFRFVGSRFGVYSIVVRRSGMKKILDFLKNYKLFLPYDMEYYLPESINMFTVLDDVVTNKTDSLTDNAKPNYKHME